MLNQPHNPCEPSLDYNFAKCVETKIMTDAGCQPPWRRFHMEALPLCDNFTLLNEHFFGAYWKRYIADRKTIIDETKCLMPCSYMEYKVSR